MSQTILDKIKYLCKNIAKVEWSGPLFYSVKGDIKKPETFEITLEDILPLDMGTSGYTEYDLDHRFIDYLMDDDKRTDWNVGHIHSHNTMDVFFSGVDMKELHDNSPLYNYYLSLIVNNYDEFIAKVAFIGTLDEEIKEVPYFALDDNGERYIIQKPNFTLKREKMFTYNCKIISPVEKIIEVDTEFGKRVAEIMKPKPAKVVVPVDYKNGTWINGKFVSTTEVKPTVVLPVSNNLEAVKAAQQIKDFKVDASKLSERGKKVKDLMKNIPFEDFEDLSDRFELTLIDKFVIELLKFTSPLEPNEGIEDALVALEDLDLTAYEIATSIMENYTFLYDKHFNDATNEEFIEDTNEVIATLLDEVEAYPFINVTIEAIKAMIVEFEKSEEDAAVR